jgi:hypothetical protein
MSRSGSAPDTTKFASRLAARTPADDLRSWRITPAIDAVLVRMKDRHVILDATVDVGYRFPVPRWPSALATELARAACERAVSISAGTDDDADWNEPPRPDRSAGPGIPRHVTSAAVGCKNARPESAAESARHGEGGWRSAMAMAIACQSSQSKSMRRPAARPAPVSSKGHHQ